MLRTTHNLVEHRLARCQNHLPAVISTAVFGDLGGLLKAAKGDDSLGSVAGGDAIDEEVDVYGLRVDGQIVIWFGEIVGEEVECCLEDADVGFDAEEEDVQRFLGPVFIFREG